MPDSDSKLVPGPVVVQAWDLCVDSQDPARRHNSTPFRRALGHDFRDGLTINWGSDYPGGVTSHGVVEMPEHLRVHKNLEVHGSTRLEGGAEVFGDSRFEGKLEARKIQLNVTEMVMGPQHVPIPITIQLDVAAEIQALKKRIAELEQQVKVTG